LNSQIPATIARTNDITIKTIDARIEAINASRKLILRRALSA